MNNDDDILKLFASRDNRIHIFIQLINCFNIPNVFTRLIIKYYMYLDIMKDEKYTN